MQRLRTKITHVPSREGGNVAPPADTPVNYRLRECSILAHFLLIQFVKRQLESSVIKLTSVSLWWLDVKRVKNISLAS